MKERDNFEDFDLIDPRVKGVYYTGSKSHPWSQELLIFHLFTLNLFCGVDLAFFSAPYLSHRVPESERVNEVWFEALGA